jgi:hypothetical protein
MSQFGENKMSFLPVDYEVPKSKTNYMKLMEGSNQFRVLSHCITGWEYWTEEGETRKPNRVHTFEEMPAEIKSPDNWDSKNRPKHFWAFVVYNRVEDSIQILELTQKRVQQAIKSLVSSKSWGDPKSYDIVILKELGKTPKDTKYSVMPEPKEALDEMILHGYEVKNINLDALYEGKNPFESEDVVLTKEQESNIK